MPVKLNDVIDALESAGQEHAYYLDKRSGEIVLVTDGDLADAENEKPISEYPEWQSEAVLKIREILSSEDFVELPDQFEIDEYRMMEDFCLQFENRSIGEELGRLIKGSGAFRRFKNSINSMGVADAWYSFRKKRLEELAIEWLEDKEIPYQREDLIDNSERVH